MSEATEKTRNEKPKIVGLWLTLLLAFSVMGGSMTKLIDQYGDLVGFLLGIVAGAVVLVVGVAIGYLAGRSPQREGT